MLEIERTSKETEQINQTYLALVIKALSLLSIDSKNLRGLILKGRFGPVREQVFTSLHQLFKKFKFQKIHPKVLDSELFGGLDFTRTLQSGKPVRTSGYLRESNSLILLSMAERLEKGLVGKYSRALDTNRELCFILSDESIDGEHISEAFKERLAFSVSMEGLHHSASGKILFDLRQIQKAQKQLKSIPIENYVIRTLTQISLKLGIESVRGPILAAYAARASAAFSNHLTIQDEDIIEAVKLVLSHRATILPSEEEVVQEDDNQAPPPKGEEASDESGESKEFIIPPDILLDAIQSSLSPEALKNLVNQAKTLNAPQSSSGTGQKKLSNRRGRPLPARYGKLDITKRLDIIETLKAAAPWQKVRKEIIITDPSKIIIRGDDIRVKRYEEQSDRLIIFAVDASGTSALGRLGETKGAIEILLAEAYRRRDQVALISFRGEGAEIELPPTRSLVQTKKRLASLPAGGGTPLASGLSTSYNLALNARSRGMTPSLAILTDGKGNIALDGTPSRIASNNDTEIFAKKFQSAKIPCIVIDTSNRPQIQAKILAENLNGIYLALPRADSKRLSAAVSAAMD